MNILERLTQRRKAEEAILAAGRTPLSLREVGCFLNPKDRAGDITVVASQTADEWEAENEAHAERLAKEGPYWVRLNQEGINPTSSQFPALLKKLMDAHPNGPPPVTEKPTPIMTRKIER